MFHRFGTQVTVLERSHQLLAHGYGREVGQAIGQVFSDEGMHVAAEAVEEFPACCRDSR